MTLPGKATHQQTRGFNRGLVLRTLYDLRADQPRRGRPPHRPDPHHRQRPRRRRPRRGPRPRGRAAGRRAAARPRSSLQVVDDARLVVGLDLGEQRVRRRARQPPRRDPRDPSSVPVDGRDGDEALAALTAWSTSSSPLAPETSPILGIGVGTPGLVDAATGTIRWAVNLDWQDLPLGRILTERTGLPGERRQRLAGRGARRVPVRRRRRRAAEPRRDQGRPRASAPASSSAASSSRATASAPARSATPSSSTTARSAAAAGSAASRPSPARGRSSRRDRGGAATPDSTLGRRLAPRRRPGPRRRRAGARRRRRDGPPGRRRGRALARPGDRRAHRRARHPAGSSCSAP